MTTMELAGAGLAYVGASLSESAAILQAIDLIPWGRPPAQQSTLHLRGWIRRPAGQFGR